MGGSAAVSPSARGEIASHPGCDGVDTADNRGELCEVERLGGEPRGRQVLLIPLARGEG
ncbi:hypothetical protein [Streptomyces niveus]|uniref:hypothetical protein n=1 Tax=Streptomyces niveus TaxID=193462 RepID=UPI0036D28768